LCVNSEDVQEDEDNDDTYFEQFINNINREDVQEDEDNDDTYFEQFINNINRVKSATKPLKKAISNDTVTSSNVSDKVVQKVKVVDDEKSSREITCMSEEKLKSTSVEVSDKAVSGKSKEKADPKLKEGNISLGNEKKKKEIGRAAKSAYMDVEASGSSSLSGGPPKAKIRKLLSERFSSINIDTGLLH